MTTFLPTTPGRPGAVARTIYLCLALSTLSWDAWAHGGEDHGDVTAPVVGIGMAPRASAQTEDFEIVAQAQGTTLTLTLDRFATNAPVVDAQIEVESGSTLKQTAKQIAPGVYMVQGTPFGVPGSYPLSFSIQAGETSDLMATTLEIVAPTTDTGHAHGGVKWAAWTAWSVSAAALVLLLTLVLLRRRNRIGQQAQ